MRLVTALAFRSLALCSLAVLASCKGRSTSLPAGPPGAIPRSESREPPALPPGGRWNLLLVTLDTVRADVLTELGSKKVVARNVEQLASEGVLLTDAQTVTPLTLPAHCSILTGLYPGTHGVRHNARYALGKEHVTIATVLRGAGYDTAAFVAAFPLSPEYGTNQGFDVYDASFERTRGVDSDRPASAVNAHAIPWLKARTEKPFFAWVHYFDAHDPYTPPEPWKSRFPDAPYLAEVAAVDAALGEVLATLQDTGKLEHTLVVVSADHGEGLGEHGEPFHGLLLHVSTVHVPIVFWGGPLRREAERVRFPTSVTDIMPTALALLGVPPPAGVQGLDLSAQLRGDAKAPDRAGAISETWYGWLEFGWSPLRGIADEDHRYIEAPTPELYDLASDPKELSNVAAADSERAAALRAALLSAEAATSSAGASAGAAQPMSEQEMEALQSLGYVASGGGVALEASAIPTGPDPKAMIGLYEQYNQARARLDGGDPQGALLLLDQIVPKDPRNLQFRGKRAKALAYLGRVQDAEAEFRSMIAQDEKHVLTYWDLSLLLDIAGQSGKAVDVLRQLQAVDPAYVGLTERIATLLAHAGRTDEAVALLLRAPEAGSESQAGERRAQAGRLLLRAGDAAGAVKAFDSALEASPRGEVEPWLLAAARQEADGQGGQSLLTLKTQAESHPSEVASWEELCHAALRQDARDLAASACATLTTLPGHEPPDQAALVRALIRAGRLDEARERSTSLLKGNPGWWWLHQAWAEELERRGDRPGARAAYEAWIALEPDAERAKAGLRRLR